MVAQVLIVIIAAIGVTIYAEKRGIQAPLLIAMVSLAASFIPGLPRLELEPEIILTIVLPPLLFSAAVDFSFVSFIRRVWSISNLGIFLVLATTIVVGVVAASAVPGLTLASALVLAAVVSPPDAVTAVAIGRQLNLPRGLQTVLKGESLINDAAALTLFSFATAAVAGTHLFIGNGAVYFAYAAIVGIFIGMALGGFVHAMRLRLSNPTMITVVSVLVPFAAYLLAEEFNASGVLAVVAAGLSLGHNASEAGFASRIQERMVWKTVDAVLEAFVFAYIGLQLRFVVMDAINDPGDQWVLLGAAIVVLIAVILIRILWVFATGALAQWTYRLAERRQRKLGRVSPIPFTWKENLIISWTGMRGVVTLAAAAGIPLFTVAGTAFPGRDAIQAIAFAVTIGTLLIQGLTLPWLIRTLNVTDPREAAFERAQAHEAHSIARKAASHAVEEFLRTEPSPEVKAMAQAMLDRAKASTQLLDENAADAERGLRRQNGQAMLALGQAVLEAQRKALIAERDADRLDDEVMRKVLEEMDLQQAAMSQRTGAMLRSVTQ